MNYKFIRKKLIQSENNMKMKLNNQQIYDYMFITLSEIGKNI